VIVSASVAALAVTVMAGAPALARSSAHAAAAAAGTPVIKSGFKDGPVTVNSSNFKTVASMSLGPGSWVMFGKVFVENFDSSANNMTCELLAGTNATGEDFDLVSLTLEPLSNGVFIQDIALNVVHHFSSTGKVRLLCSGSATMRLAYIKITAIKAGTLTNVQLA